MSLPVGTLVLCVRVQTDPSMNGRVGEIAIPLSMNRVDGHPRACLCYGVRVDGTLWAALPHQVIPISAPRDTVDVTSGMPLSEAA